MFGSHLSPADRTPSGGSEPNAIAQHGRLVYVLNTAGSSSVIGFQLREGRLVRILESQRFLSANSSTCASVTFSPDGRYLAVTERATNNIDVFRVQADGRLSDHAEYGCWRRHVCRDIRASTERFCVGDGWRGPQLDDLILFRGSRWQSRCAHSPATLPTLRRSELLERGDP